METLKAVSRQGAGRREARKLRSQGKVPGIIYGHKEPPVNFACDAHDLALLVRNGEHLVELDLDGTKGNYLVKDVQLDPFGAYILHVDLTRVNLDERVEVTVPVMLRGTPAGEADGGILMPGLAELEVSCVVTNIPEQVTVRVNDLKIGDAIHVRDLPAIEGVDVLSDPDSMIASCQPPTVAPEEEEEVAAEEGAAEPEVIGKGKKEDEEE